MESKRKFCEKLSGNTCPILKKDCLRLSASSKKCDMLGYYNILTKIERDTPQLSKAVRKAMVPGFLSNWRLHAENPLPGKKDMTARPLEKEMRVILKSQLSPLGVSVADTGKKLVVWEKVNIVADALADKQRFPRSIFSFKTWLGEAQIRETFGYAYLAKTWLGQKNIRVYMVSIGATPKFLESLIQACKPYIDGVFSLCGSPYLDDLIEELREMYSEG